MKCDFTQRYGETHYRHQANDYALKKIRFARNRILTFVTKCNHLWQLIRNVANSKELEKLFINQ